VSLDEDTRNQTFTGLAWPVQLQPHTQLNSTQLNCIDNITAQRLDWKKHTITKEHKV